MKKYFLILMMMLFVSPVGAQTLGNSVLDYCFDTYEESGNCPKDLCRLACLDGGNYEGCEIICKPKLCQDIDAHKCPLDQCQLLPGCSGEDVCYPLPDRQEPKCGDLAYSGKRECCEGFVKRCGLEFFDGTCDMEADYTMFSVPTCLPCGNSICNQFENRCNCPEDCCDGRKECPFEEYPLDHTPLEKRK